MKLFTVIAFLIFIQCAVWPAQVRADEVTVSQKGAVLTTALTFGALAGGHVTAIGLLIASDIVIGLDLQPKAKKGHRRITKSGR